MSEPAAIADHKPSATHHAHGHDEHHGSHLMPYLIVGGLLFVFTGITVWLSYWSFEKIGIFIWAFDKIGVHGFAINVVIGLAVATFKVCLVGAWFMHLKDEKATIWRPLLFTFFFCLGLFALCLLAYLDPIFSTSHTVH